MDFFNIEEKDLPTLLSLKKKSEIEELFSAAKKMRIKHCGNKVYYRALIEASNICKKNCSYCGICSSNKNLNRYTLSEEQILAAVKKSISMNFGSIAIQAGENSSPKWVDFIEKIILKIKEISNDKIGITLSLGEQSEESYSRWFKAGAHRYLLRIETSNKKLYNSLHPKSHSFEKRVECLHILKNIGYQLGTGVMCGLPNQTIEDLANDILFFKKIDADMIGLGPFIPHPDTKLCDLTINKKEQLTLALKMLATTRLYLKDVNMVASTALQALNPKGRELGTEAGANIIMPNLTDVEFKKEYQLYAGKPNLKEFSLSVQKKLDDNLIALGNKIGYGTWGDSPHAKR